MDALPEDEFEAAMLVIVHSSVTPNWLLKRIALQLGVSEPADEKLAILSQLYKRLVEIHESGRRAVVLIDEAQMLQGKELMEEFRGLLNLEVPGQKLISFVFFGLPELERNLALDPPLAQRVAMRYRLSALDAEHTANYVAHRMQLVGCEEEVFPEASLQAIHRWTQGVPRVINTLCDNILLELFFAQQRVADETFVAEVAGNLQLGQVIEPPDGSVSPSEVLAIDGAPGWDAVVAVDRHSEQTPEVSFETPGQSVDSGGGYSLDDIASRVAAEPIVVQEDEDDVLTVPVPWPIIDAQGADHVLQPADVAPAGETGPSLAAELPSYAPPGEVQVEQNGVQAARIEGLKPTEQQIGDPLAFLQEQSPAPSSSDTVQGNSRWPVEAPEIPKPTGSLISTAAGQDTEYAIDFEVEIEEGNAGDSDEALLGVAIEASSDDSANALLIDDAMTADRPASESGESSTNIAPSKPNSPSALRNEPTKGRFKTSSGKTIDLSEIDDLLADIQTRG
ncbi:MAG: AAA family ATPase [Myxococcota bacterium]